MRKLVRAFLLFPAACRCVGAEAGAHRCVCGSPEKLAVYDAIKPAVEVPPYGQGRKEYKAPKEWKITEQ